MTQRTVMEKSLNVVLSDDKCIAYLEYYNEEEGFSCTTEELEQFVESKGVKHGLLREALLVFVNNPSAYLKDKCKIAEGVSPVQGIDGYIQVLIGKEDESEQRPLEAEDGKVDYKELIQLDNVRSGQIIAKRIDPVDGIPGKAVTGEEIPFRSGKDARFKVGKNVVVSPDGSAMYAAIDGLVSRTDGNKLNVFPVYEVNGDVDYKHGNIDFVGNVVIRGNVLTGFKVKAAGDIRVVGGVEGAELEAGGSIEITGGIIGYNKGLIHAGHHVKCTFIQEGNVDAGEDVLVSQSIMHSNIRAGHAVICAGTKGLIVGGSTQAGEHVSARVVGNTMSTVTSIEVGVLPRLRNEMNELRKEMREQMDSLDKTKKALTLLDQLAAAGQLTPDKMAMRIKLNSTQKSALHQSEEMKMRILEIEKVLEDTSRARVDILKMIYGGSKIVIGRYTKFIKDPVSRMSFYYQDGDITMVPYV
nr:FapA family protein [Paenibacillus xylanexedens]